MASVRFKAIPPGVAPHSIRQQWLGVEIPLPTEKELVENPPISTDIGSRNPHACFLVSREKAIQIMEGSGRTGLSLHLRKAYHCTYLAFEKGICELVQ